MSRLATLFLAATLLAFGAEPARPQGASRWGLVAAPSDSTTTVSHPRPMPAWEKAVVWPYRVVTYPGKLAVDGLGAGLIFLDENRVIYRIQEFLKPPAVPFGFNADASIGGTGGPGAGLTFYHDDFPGDSGHFRFGFDATIRGSHRVHTGLRVGSFEAGAGYRIRKSARYFGLGPDSDADDESFYTQETSWGGAAWHRGLSGGADLILSGVYSTAGARGPREADDPALPEIFGEALPAGYGDRSDGLSTSIEIASRGARDTGRPDRGTNARVKAVYFAGTDGTSPDFWTYRGEVEQFVPLWFTKRALALRGVLTWIDPAGRAVIPFQRLVTNDDPDLFRGYEDFRFRDRGLALVTAEYRWPVWAPVDASGPGVDAYLLADLGQVFADFQEISLDNLTRSWGGGLRLVSRRGFNARVELARADEELQLRLAASQVFQYRRSSLLDGKSPVPER